MKKEIVSLIFFIIILVGVVIFNAVFIGKQKPDKKIEIGKTSISVIIADTPISRAQGLSNRPYLEKGTGMFFIFDEPGYHNFWMKDMKFPIDIIWFDEGMRVIYVRENVSPDTYPQVFTPQVLAKYVLEVPAHFTAEHNIKIGNQFSF